MAVRWYKPKEAGTKLDLYIDPQEFVQADDQARLATIQELEAASDPVRTELAICKGYQSLEAFDVALKDERYDLLDRLDYYDYGNRDETISVRDGAWFTPIAVEDHCGEEVGFEAVNAIDGDTGTWWQHAADEVHQITFKLRDYPKKMDKIRIRRGGNVRSALNDITIQVANSLGGLDNPNNVAVTGASISVDAAWNEIEFTKKQRGIYIRLTGFTSNHASNEVRIREIEAWVVTRDP